MTTTGHLDLGAAQIVDSAGELIGYAYTEATPTGQMQRWILYRDPVNSFKVQPPPERMAGWSLADWKANVRSLWKDRAFYVRAKATVYRYGETYGGVQWTRIPFELPHPSFPDGAGDYQLDPLGKVINLRQEDLHGLAYTDNGLQDSTSAEYWLLPSSYQPAGARSRVEISPGTAGVSSLEQFLAIANESFRPGSVFVITGCANYNGSAIPGTL